MWIYYLIVLLLAITANILGNQATTAIPVTHIPISFDIPTLNLIFLAFMVGVYYTKVRKMETNISNLCKAITKLHDEHISCPHCGPISRNLNHEHRDTEPDCNNS